MRSDYLQDDDRKPASIVDLFAAISYHVWR